MEDQLRLILARLAAAEARAKAAEEYAESTCRIYHGLYAKHSVRLDALERKGSSNV